MSQVYVGNGSGGGGGGGVTSVEGTAPIEVNGVSGVPQTGAVVVSTTQSDLHVARFIVSAGGTADGANYTTLAAAYTAAVAAGGNQTIFLQPGTYSIGTQALTAGINISAFDCDAITPNVTINGLMTANITGECTFSGINFLNNSDNVLAITGSGASKFSFVQCFLNVSGTAFAISSTNSSAAVDILDCQGDISGTSAYFNMTGGGVNVQNSFLFNGQNSSTNNVLNNCAINVDNSVFNSPIDATGVGGDVSVISSSMVILNTTCITTGGGPNADLVIYNSHIDSNNATAIVIGAGSTMTIANTSVGSSATDAISGAGVLNYAPIAFTKSSSTVSVSTQNPIRFGPQISPELANTNGTVYYDGTIIATVAPGTSGDVLTSNGAGSPPSYQPPSGGGITEFFSVYLSAPTGNVTGDNTLYGPILFDGIITNTSSSYNAGTGNYTIPSDGEYSFQQTIVFVGGDALTQEYLALWGGSGYSIRAFQLFPTAQAGANTTILSASISSHFTAGQTVNVQALVGGTNKNIAIYGAAPSGLSTSTVFSGFKFA